MKSGNKIFSLFFLFFFLVSNTGLPFALHVCQAMKKVSVESCDMCRTRHNNIPSGLQISNERNGCCETKVAAKPIEDNYLSVQKNLDKQQTISIFSEQLSVSILVSSPETTISTDTSPPLYKEQPLFILYSSFLI